MPDDLCLYDAVYQASKLNGVVLGMREVALEMLEARFGEVPTEIRTFVETADEEAVRSILGRVFDASSARDAVGLE